MSRDVPKIIYRKPFYQLIVDSKLATYLLNNKTAILKSEFSIRDVARGWTLTVLPRVMVSARELYYSFYMVANLLMKDNFCYQLGDADLSGMSLNACWKILPKRGKYGKS
jgi:hypothetical protein